MNSPFIPLPAWLDDAICGGMFDVMVPPENLSPAGAAAAYKRARAVCADCPAKAQCLQAALDEEGTIDKAGRAGIRGGLTPDERMKISRRIGHYRDAS